MRSYKAKLNITSKKVSEAFKQMAGAYRILYNVVLDIQDTYKLNHLRSPRNKQHLTGTELLNMSRPIKKSYPFLNKIDGGIFTSAIFAASKARTMLTEFEPPKYLTRKNGTLKFKTSGAVKVFYDYIHIPKLGKVKLYEKGYLPQGKSYSNITFSHDGNHWYISLQVEENPAKTQCNGKDVSVDFTPEGDLILDNEVIENVVSAENYQKELKKYKRLAKKLKRQSLLNRHKSTKGQVATRKALSKSSTRLDNIKKDFFKKTANEVARTKPNKLHVLSQHAISTHRNGYLSRKSREAGVLEFLNIITKKLQINGTTVEKHCESNTSGSGVYACGELHNYHEWVRKCNLMKQELLISKEQKQAKLGNIEPSSVDTSINTKTTFLFQT